MRQQGCGFAAALSSGGNRPALLVPPRVCGSHLVIALIGELDTTDAMAAAAAVTVLAAPHGLVLRLLTLIGVPGVHDTVAAAAENAPAAAPDLPPGNERSARPKTGGAVLSGTPTG